MLGLLVLSAALVGGEPPATAIDEEAPVAIPEPSELALRYHRTGNWLWIGVQVWGLLVPAAVVASGLSARLRDAAWRIGRALPVAVAAFLALYLTLHFVVSLPLGYYLGHVRPHAYGRAPESYTAADWFLDALKRLGVRIAVGALVAWVPFWLMARSPRRWWLGTGLLILPFLAASMLVVPVVYDPLFNRFGPVPDKGLEAKILALADRAGIDGARVFEVDKSRDSTGLNAYVTGLWGTHRIVLYDTLREKLTDREVLAIVGHELGHYVLGHVLRSLLLASAATLAGLYVIHRVMAWLVGRAWFRRRTGIERPGDIAALPLLMLLVNALMLLVAPATNAYSRWQEHEADRFALEITRDNAGVARAFVALQRENLSVPRPGPLYTLFRGTHPGLGDRIDFSNAYHPWRDGRPLRYAPFFRDRP